MKYLRCILAAVCVLLLFSACAKKPADTSEIEPTIDFEAVSEILNREPTAEELEIATTSMKEYFARLAAQKDSLDSVVLERFSWSNYEFVQYPSRDKNLIARWVSLLSRMELEATKLNPRVGGGYTLYFTVQGEQLADSPRLFLEGDQIQYQGNIMFRILNHEEVREEMDQLISETIT